MDFSWDDLSGGWKPHDIHYRSEPAKANDEALFRQRAQLVRTNSLNESVGILLFSMD
jgi:hypothetical protein